MQKAAVIEGEELLGLCQDEQGTHQLLVNTSKIPKDNWRPPLLEEDRVVLRQALSFNRKEEWMEMHEKLEEDSNQIVVQKGGQTVISSG